MGVDGLSFHGRRTRPAEFLLQRDIVTDAETALDALYTTALRSAGNWDDGDCKESSYPSCSRCSGIP